MRAQHIVSPSAGWAHRSSREREISRRLTPLRWMSPSSGTASSS
jgi:hypothetical protein